MMNRKTMQKVVATVAIVGVAASGAITFMSVAAAQQGQSAPQVVTDVNQTATQQQIPATPDAGSAEVTIPSDAVTQSPAAGN